MTHEPAEPNQSRWAGVFFMIWTGQAISLLGSQLVQFALVWWLTQTTGSATVLALASLVAMLPQIVLGPLAGALVDRWNRRATMIAADGLTALTAVALVLLFWSGQVQVWHIYIVIFLRATAGTVHWAAMTASTSLMVPRQHLSRIQGINEMLGGGLNILAAPLGALLLALLPMQGVLAIDIFTALAAILPLLLVAIPQPAAAAESGGARVSIWQDLRAGLRYVAAWPGLLMIMGIATLINLLLAPAFSLLPLLVTRYLNGQAMQLASLESFLGLGVILGGSLLGVWGGFRRRMLTSTLGLFGLGLAALLMGISPNVAFSLALAAAFLVGFFQPILNGPLMAIIQAVVAPEMQGRVFTLLVSVATAMTPLGLALAGPVADRLGVPFWFILAGITISFLGLGSLFVPAIMHLEDGRQAAPAQAGQQPTLDLSSKVTPGD